MSATTYEEMKAALQAFANEHKVILEDRGEVGFGRPCVGFLRGNGYVSHNPYHYLPTGELNPPLEPLAELADDRLYPPTGCENAYHKHDCLAILVEDEHYDVALWNLYRWVEHLNQLGVEVVQYQTGATGIQAMLTGVFGWAVRVKKATGAATEGGAK